MLENSNSIQDESQESKKSLGSVSGDASAEEDAILEELAMISSHRSSTTSRSSTNSTPTPIASGSASGSAPDPELDETRDAFHIEDMPSPLSLPASTASAASGAVHRPIPRVGAVGQHPRLQALQAGSSSLNTSLPVSSSASAASEDANSNKSASGGMSRSISDSTLRRAALHLNLNQNSVLPSFTSLQQFKVIYFTSEIIGKMNFTREIIDKMNFTRGNN